MKVEHGIFLHTDAQRKSVSKADGRADAERRGLREREQEKTERKNGEEMAGGIPKIKQKN